MSRSLCFVSSLLLVGCGRSGLGAGDGLDDGASETFGDTDPDTGTSVSTSATSATSDTSDTSTSGTSTSGTSTSDTDTATGTSDTGTSGPTTGTSDTDTSTSDTATSTSGTSSTDTSDTSDTDTGPMLDVGIPQQCLPDDGDTDCDLCIKESCCDESTACVDDFGCLCMIVCLQQGGSFPECTFICGFDPQESPQLFDLIQCVFGSCAQSC